MRMFTGTTQTAVQKAIDDLDTKYGYPKRATRYNDKVRNDDKGITLTYTNPMQGKTEWGMPVDVDAESKLSLADQAKVKDVPDLGQWLKTAVVLEI